MRVEEHTIRFRHPTSITEQMGLHAGPETCHRCHVELWPGVEGRERLDALVRCFDDSGNEYGHHLDEPEGAGAGYNDSPTHAEMNAEQYAYAMHDGWVH